MTFVISSGDGGSYEYNPGVIGDGISVNSAASSPNVLAVGGTTLAYDANGNPVSETGWGYDSTQTPGDFVGSGGGVSVLEPEPSYQTAVAGVLSGRGVPDVSFEADPNTGVQQYDTSAGGWFEDGGTSLSAPCWAAIIAIANQGRVLQGHTTLNGATDPALPAIYGLPTSDFNDITSGTNGVYSCTSGYDLVTGRGTPIANKLIPDLVAAEAQAATTTVVTSTNGSSTYGQAVTFTATVTPASGSSETGTVQFQIDGNNFTRYPSAATPPSYTTSTLTADSHSVVAVYSGDSNFTTSTSNTFTQNVGQATLTITANSDSKTYGTSKSFSGTAFTATGLVTANGDSITAVNESSTGSLASATVGSYAIVASTATGTGLSNYSVSYVNGSLTLNQATLTITANNDSKTYGTSKSFSGTAFTATGLVTANGDSITGVNESSTGSLASATVAQLSHRGQHRDGHGSGQLQHRLRQRQPDGYPSRHQHRRDLQQRLIDLRPGSDLHCHRDARQRQRWNRHCAIPDRRQQCRQPGDACRQHR